MHYEDAGGLMDYWARVLDQTTMEATISLHLSALNPHLQKMTELADRMFWFFEMPRLKAEQRSTRICQKRKERWKLTHVVA
jgi:hypothetical protein